MEIEPRRPLIDAGLAIWPALPLLLVANAALGLAMLPGFLAILAGLPAPGVVLLGLGLGPIWHCLAGLARRLDDGDRVPLAAFLRPSTGVTMRGWRIVAPPALAVAALVAGIQANLLIPTLVAAVVAACLGLVLPHAMLLAQHRADTGRRLWLDALGLGATTPASLLAVPATLILMITCIGSGLAIVALVIPAPAIVAMTIVSRDALYRLAPVNP